MGKYYIIPTGTWFDEIEAGDRKNALEKFVDEMDTNMSAYFKAVTEEELQAYTADKQASHKKEVLTFIQNELLSCFPDIPEQDVGDVAARAYTMYDSGKVSTQYDGIHAAVEEYKNSVRLHIVKADITTLKVDAIVNAANPDLQPGGGVCGAIYRAAGYDELKEYTDMLRRTLGPCETGKAVVSPGKNLSARMIIHAVGPIWQGGTNNEPYLLRSAYKSSLQAAFDSGCKTVAFPLISAGIYGYPVKDAWKEALTVCQEFLNAHPGIKIIFAVIDDAVMQAAADVMEEFKAVKKTAVEGRKLHGLRRTRAEEMYTYIDRDINSIDDDYESGYLTLFKGDSGTEYLWICNNAANAAINITTGDIYGPAEIEKLFGPWE